MRALTPFGRLVVAILALVVAGSAFLFIRNGGSSGPGGELDARERSFDTNDPIERACALPDRELLRIWRGHDQVASEDITIVPQPPNFSGSFGTTSHSGPWDYVQTIPLVLYGPGNIKAAGPIEDPANVTDVYPTAGELTGVALPPRKGETLEQALEPGASPKLIVTLVWDGVGRNVLDRWEGRWPALAKMEAEGTSFVKATVGSSPSITPATHSSLGTGSFPRQHGITAIEMRRPDGSVGTSFAGKDPSELRLTTFADEIDRELGNAPVVGLLAWKSWHMGMMGHGSQLSGGDKDQLALVTDTVVGNPLYYELPGTLRSTDGPEMRAEELDLEDGEADGQWMGHVILEEHDNPAWVRHEGDLMIEMLESGGYGNDDVVDLFFLNFKPTDIVGHRHNVHSPEMGEVLEAQDAELARLLEWLDRNVKDYVVIVTSDHGNTPPAEDSGGWPLLQGQLQADVDNHFKIPAEESLITQTTAVGPFLNYETMKKNDVTAGQIARFLNSYTIGENWPDAELPDGYQERSKEPILAAAFESDRLDDVMRCAFGQPFPPKGLSG